MVSMGTGALGGLYYPTGRAICDLVNRGERQHGIRCSVEATSGSVYNVRAVEAGELDFAIVQSDVHFDAYRGRGSWQGRPAGRLRSVLALYPETVTLLARADAGIGALADLRGKRVNIGHTGSGTRSSWDALLATLGWTLDDLGAAAELRAAPSLAALCAEEIDADVLLVGHPSGQVAKAIAECGARLVPVQGAAVDAMLAERPYYSPATIPAAAYAQPGDVATYAVSATLVTSADVPADVVREIVRTIVTKREQLGRRQPVVLSGRAEEQGRAGLTAPMHPAAVQALRELGVQR
jgi:hypothetical protein